MMTEDRCGVLLLNLGGPETLADVRPFLYNLFSDPEIIRIRNPLFRKLLARIIAHTRQAKSQELYRQIGGGSPLRRITEDQAAALSALLKSQGVNARVYVGMRCWKPTMDEAIERILKDGVRRLVLLPLFPQYSVTTTGSCFSYFHLLDKRLNLSSKMQVSYVESWYETPLYLRSMAELISEGLQQFAAEERPKVHLLFSAHSIPERYVREGDPYLNQTQKCVELINTQLNCGNPWSLAFQSKVGPVKWLGPSTTDILKDLAKSGISKVLVVPVSFVSDHIETLQEIDIAYKKLSYNLGIAEFHRVKALNLHPKFIEALASIVLKHIPSDNGR
jgi:protoporphyrin/coproporphyrin ferrochelatase